MNFSLCIYIEQFLGDLPNLFFNFRFGDFPALTSKLIYFRLSVGQTFILADQVESIHRQVEFIAITIFNEHKIIDNGLELDSG